MRTKTEAEQILEYWKSGHNQSETSRVLNISRSTIRDYFKRFNAGKSLNELNNCSEFKVSQFLPEQRRLYSYLLGLYLGDGHICKTKSLRNGNVVYKFRIFQDKKYTNLIDECINAMKCVFETDKITVIAKHGCKEIVCYKNNLPEWFPQHGSGKKHDRKIQLAEWQKEIVENSPKEFIRGLIHSDGCRYKQTQYGKYEYYYYSFSNRSEDIHELFKWACSLVDIFPRRTGHSSVVSKQKEVVVLDNFIGPKN